MRAVLTYRRSTHNVSSQLNGRRHDRVQEDFVNDQYWMLVRILVSIEVRLVIYLREQKESFPDNASFKIRAV